jgi:glutamine amidotransferase
VIAVLDYGIGNLGSARKALVHLGADARLVRSPQEMAGAAGVVLPGVGSFGPCMDALTRAGLDRAVREAIDSGRPFLGICVGLQMLYEGSDEDPDRPGLGILDGRVVRLAGSQKLPQMQWNLLEPVPGRPSGMLGGLEQPWAYFVHSYATNDTQNVVATCQYGGPVVAAIERGNIWATQFHPEKSGRIGLAVLGRFVRACLDGR